jgi:hypothetical protein
MRPRWVSLAVAGALAAGGVGVAAPPALLWAGQPLAFDRQLQPAAYQVGDPFYVGCSIGSPADQSICEYDTGSGPPYLIVSWAVAANRGLRLQGPRVDVATLTGVVSGSNGVTFLTIGGRTAEVPALEVPGDTAWPLIGPAILARFGDSVTFDLATGTVDIEGEPLLAAPPSAPAPQLGLTDWQKAWLQAHQP